MAMENVHGIMRDLDQELWDYNARWNIIHQCVDNIRQDRIMAICAKYELESDEFYTREEKAKKILDN